MHEITYHDFFVHVSKNHAFMKNYFLRKKSRIGTPVKLKFLRS
jgi:hypothetical protein